MKIPKISVIIATWNGEQFIEKCLDSVFSQDYLLNGNKEELLDVLIIDNSSQDDTLKILKEKYQNRVKVVANKENLGFARAYNQGIHWSNGRFVLVLNQDVYLHPKFISESINFFDNYQEVAAINGQILRWADKKEDSQVVDSLGLEIKKNFSVNNIMENEIISKQQEIKPIFGFTGTAVFLRRAALYDIIYKQEFFDESFFSYKEDVDMSWRLRWRNWDIVYLPYAIAYHKRTLRKNQEKGHFDFFSHYLNKPDFLNYLSYRNHILTMIKNASGKLILKNIFSILWYEWKKKIFLLLFRPNIFFKVWFDIFKQSKKLLKKRKYILSNRKINYLGINQWLK